MKNREILRNIAVVKFVSLIKTLLAVTKLVLDYDTTKISPVPVELAIANWEIWQDFCTRNPPHKIVEQVLKWWRRAQQKPNALSSKQLRGKQQQQ